MSEVDDPELAYVRRAMADYDRLPAEDRKRIACAPYAVRHGERLVRSYWDAVQENALAEWDVVGVGPVPDTYDRPRRRSKRGHWADTKPQ